MRHGQGWAVLGTLMCLGLGTGLVSTTAKAGEWTLPDTRLGVRTAPLLLLSRPDVQADLRLEPAQIKAALDTINDLTQRAAALRGKSGAAVVAERRAIDEAQVDWLGKNLTGNQLTRLRQIELQWEGASAMLSRPTVAEYMKLTPDQRQSLVQAISERNSRRSRGSTTLQEETALSQKVQGMLSETQKELWANILGSPCRFALSDVPPKSRDDATQQAGHARRQP